MSHPDSKSLVKKQTGQVQESANPLLNKSGQQEGALETGVVKPVQREKKQGHLQNEGEQKVIVEKSASSSKQEISDTSVQASASLASSLMQPDLQAADSLRAETMKKLKNRVVMDAFKSVREGLGISTEQGRINDEALSLLLVEDELNGSAAYVQLKDAGLTLLEICRKLDNKESVDTSDIIEMMIRLSENSTMYHDLHTGVRFTDTGELRQKAADTVREVSRRFFSKIYDDLGLNEAYVEDYLVECESDKDVEEAKKKVAEFCECYGNWKKYFAQQECCEIENIRDKLKLFSNYERYLKIYMAAVNPLEQTEEVLELVRELDHYHQESRVLSQMGSGVEEYTDQVDKVTKEHADEALERDSDEEFSAEEMDEDISPEQLKAIDEVDKWFLNNFNNGGIFGSLFDIRNHHGEIVSELMKKPKRERLYMYYLIETDARKDPTALDVFMSQEMYCPSVDSIKYRMLATKLKFTSYFTGSYVYMHKLTEAMQISRHSRKMLKECRQIETVDDPKDSPVDLTDPVQIRKDRLKVYYIQLKKYYSTLLSARKEEDPDNREALLKAAETMGSLAEVAMKRLVEADNLVAESSKKFGLQEGGKMKPDDLAYRGNTDGKDAEDYTGYAISGLKKIEHYAAESDGELIAGIATSWKLSGTDITNAGLYTADASDAAFGALAGLVSGTFAIYNLYKDGSSMSAGEIGRSVFDIYHKFLDAGMNIWKTVEDIKQFADATSELAKSGTTTLLSNPGLSAAAQVGGIVTAGVGLELALYEGTMSIADYVNATNAAECFKEKHERVQREKEEAKKRTDETEEEKKQRLQREKEDRYEQNMSDLARRLSEKNMVSAGLMAVGSTCALIGVLVPGAGTIAAVVGLGISVASTVIKTIQTGIVQESMFDQFFNFEDFIKRAKEAFEKKGRRISDEKGFKERMRRKLAAAAGFCDVASACDQIAKKYALFIHDKLFGPGKSKDPKELEGLQSIVSSLRLDYSETKGKEKPSVDDLAKKLAGR